MTFDEGLGVVGFEGEGWWVRGWELEEERGAIHTKAVAKTHTYSDNQCMGVVFDWSKEKPTAR